MKIQSFVENMGKWACLCIDYVYAVADYIGVTDEKAKYALIIQTCLECYDTDIMDEEFFVKNPVALMRKAAELAGVEINVSVTKKDIGSYKDLPMGYAAVRHDYNGKSHFVLAKDGLRIFDSLDNSQCVKYGKPTTARVIIFDN